MIRVRYEFPSFSLKDPVGEIVREVNEKKILKNIRPGSRIAITAGSRGVNNLPESIRELANLVRQAGGDPFVFPAMGSHGGATAEGQRALLKKLGITEDYLRCPILCSMDTVQIGITVSGLPVWIDKYAWESDGIIAINRVKPHTSFRGKHESGIVKMLVIGMGKQQGAEICHQLGFQNMSKNIEEIAHVVMSTGKIIFGVGLVENANHETCAVGVASPDEYFRKDIEMLEEAWRHFPRLPFDDVDVLVLDEIGKEVSGTGFDTNTVGRFGRTPPRVTRIAVLNLSKKTGGNGNGIGRADVTTKKVLDSYSFEETYPNAITSTAMESVKLPMVVQNDELAIKAAIKTSLISDYSNVRLVRIKNTMDLKDMIISRSLFKTASSMPNMEIIGEKFEKMSFNEEGNLED